MENKAEAEGCSPAAPGAAPSAPRGAAAFPGGAGRGGAGPEPGRPLRRLRRNRCSGESSAASGRREFWTYLLHSDEEILEAAFEQRELQCGCAMAAVVAEKLSRLFINVRQVPQLLAPPVPTTVSSSEQHNEAINVWTHLVATLILLLRFQQLSQRVDFGQDPHAQPLLIIITASITYLTFSTLAHLLQAKSEFWHYSFFFMDYVGVAIYQYGSALVHYYYAIEPSWHERIQGFFMPTAALLAWLSCAGSCYAKFRYHHHQSAWLLSRLCQEVPSGLAYLLDISPVVHRICTASPAGHTDPALLYHKCQVLFFLIGAFFFSHPYPEKLLPGKCYFFGQSHQIFHVFLVLCTLAQIEAVVLDYESRRHIYSSLQGDLAHHFSALCVFTVTCSVLTAAYMARKVRDKLSFKED
uniref:Membrane progestin receptor alpha n=1 Tax=Pavo cristatus TaxID=9049 RepID=A0A8C9G3C5_PAVCR